MSQKRLFSPSANSTSYLSSVPLPDLWGITFEILPSSPTCLLKIVDRTKTLAPNSNRGNTEFGRFLWVLANKFNRFAMQTQDRWQWQDSSNQVHQAGNLSIRNRASFRIVTMAVMNLGDSATANTVIGGTGEGSGGDNDPFKGMLDEIRVYNRALSASEVQLVFQKR